MLDSAYNTIKKYNMLAVSDTVIIGLSGGADSMALLCVLYEMSKPLSLKLHAVHVNHCLRGEDADADQLFVENYCKKLGIPCSAFKVDVRNYAEKNGLSSEEAGRILRYIIFEDVAGSYSTAKIATAHHLNDNSETVLHNILRGSGTTGLAGIHPVRGKYIRPLIETSRSEIEAYLREQNIAWRTDKTNEQAVYTRNKIRLELIPYLRENYNGSIDSALNRLSALCRADDDYMRIQTLEEFKRCCVLKNEKHIILLPDKFKTLHTALQRRLIRCILEQLNIPLKDVHMVHIEDCIKFIMNAASGSESKISTCSVLAEQSGISFIAGEYGCEDYSYTIHEGESVFIKEAAQTVSCSAADSYTKPADKNTAYISADTTNGIFEIRNRKNGDRIQPFGMKGTKKLKDYFIDNKIDISTRNKIPLIVYNNEVVWIAGMCLNDKYKVDKNTKKILKFEVK